MSWWRDVLRQCLFMCLFIIPIPIGAYTIHNGSSAVVASVSFLVLSIAIPWAYVGMAEATFGQGQRRIKRAVFGIVWLVFMAGGAMVWQGLDDWWKDIFLWDWPTIGRDIIFIVAMYAIVGAMMLVAGAISQLTAQKEGQ